MLYLYSKAEFVYLGTCVHALDLYISMTFSNENAHVCFFIQLLAQKTGY